MDPETEPRWTRRPEGSTWGDFGPEDQRGRLNLLTAARVRRAAEEVREGRVFCLSLPLSLPGGNALNPWRHPPILCPVVRDGRLATNFRVDRTHAGATDVTNDDVVVLHLQYSTQWDSLAHVGQLFDANGDGEPETVYYNGYRADVEIRGSAGCGDLRTGVNAREAPSEASTMSADALGIENMATACVQGRGVMIDLHAHLGRERSVVGYGLLMDIMRTDRVVVEEGDMVCLHTGFGDLLVELGGRATPEVLHGSCAVLDGRDRRLLRWITDSGVSVLVADNYAVEGLPAKPGRTPCASLPLHEHCLFKLGVHLGELWHLSPLARWLREHERARFLLTALPLRLPGAVGSPVTPVATV